MSEKTYILTESQVKQIKVDAIDEFREFFRRDYVVDMICRDDCSKKKLIGIVDEFAEQIKGAKE